MTDTPTTNLKGGSLGTGDILFIVVSAVAPLVVMAGVMPIALLVGGVGVPVTYLFAGAVLTIFAVGFTTMSRYVVNGGGFYAYVTHGLGPAAGIVAAFVALLSYNALEIGTFGLFGAQAHDTFNDLFGINLSWPVWAFIGLIIVWFLGFQGIDIGARVLAVLLTAETGLLLILAVAILFQGGQSGIAFDSFKPSNVFTPGLGTVLPIAFAAFMGFESTVIYRSEAKDPRRTIPRATYLAVGGLAVLYAFIAWSIVQAYGADNIVAAVATDPVGVVFTAADTYLGSWAADLMHLLIVTSGVASLLALHNAITRYTRVIANEGLLPRALGIVHPRTRSPYIAGIAQTILAGVVVLAFALADADPFTQLLIWVNTPGVLGILLLQVAVSIAVPVYFYRTTNDEGAWRTLIAPLIAAAGMVIAFYLMMTHLDLMTGASDNVNRVIALTLPAVCVVGALWAWWLRANRSPVYARIAAEALEDA